MKRILKFVLTLLVLLLFAMPAVYTNSVFGYLPILTAVIFIAFSFAYMLILKHSIIVSAKQNNAHTERGQKVSVILEVINKSILVCAKARADVFVSDYFGEIDSSTETIFTLDSKSTTEFSFDIVMEHVGIYNAGIKNMYIYDLLGIFSLKVPFESVFSVEVLPKKREIETVLSENLITDSPDASSFAENDGFDYTGVREYAIGDSMKKIHWKLSAHSIGYMTKINEVGLKSDIAVVLDMVADSHTHEELLNLLDGIVELSASLMDKAKRMDIDYRLLYVDKNLQVSSLEPVEDSDYIELIRKMALITSKPKSGMLDAEGIVLSEMQAQNRSANLVVCTSRITDGLLQVLMDVKNQQRNPVLYLIVDPKLSSSERKAELSKMRSLDDFGIVYEVIGER